MSDPVLAAIASDRIAGADGLAVAEHLPRHQHENSYGVGSRYGLSPGLQAFGNAQSSPRAALPALSLAADLKPLLTVSQPPTAPPEPPSMEYCSLWQQALVEQAWDRAWQYVWWAIEMMQYITQHGGEFAQCLWQDGRSNAYGENNYSPSWWFGSYHSGRAQHIMNRLVAIKNRMSFGVDNITCYTGLEPWYCSLCDTGSKGTNIIGLTICLCPEWFNLGQNSFGVGQQARVMMHELCHFIEGWEMQDTKCCWDLWPPCERRTGPTKVHELAQHCPELAIDTPDAYAYFGYKLWSAIQDPDHPAHPLSHWPKSCESPATPHLPQGGGPPPDCFPNQGPNPNVDLPADCFFAPHIFDWQQA